MEEYMFENVMLIDDDDATNFYNNYIIEKNNIAKNCIIFSDALEALDYLKNKSTSVDPDLIILDINMPKINGWTFIQMMDDHDLPMIPIFILSTSDHLDDIQKSTEYSRVKKYCMKPLSLGSFNN